MPSLRNFINRLAHPRHLNELLTFHDLTPLSAELADATATAKAEAIVRMAGGDADGRLQALMSSIERIGKLADEPGMVALEVSSLHEALGDLPSDHARSLHVFLHDKDGFQRAEEAVYSDARRRGRDWSPFGAAKNLKPTSDPMAIEAFREALRNHFNTRNIHVEIFERDRIGFPDDDNVDGRTRLTQVTIYREGRPDTQLAFREGELGVEVRHRVIESALTYEAETGIIECVGSQSEERAELARLLATGLLGSEPAFTPVPMRRYNLDVLRTRISFDCDPADGIEDVRVAMMRLSPLDLTAERVIVETLPKNARDIWAAVDTRLGAGALTTEYQINQARIVVHYRSKGSTRLRSLPITITHPHRSDIKDKGSIELVVANKYLPRWGLIAA